MSQTKIAEAREWRRLWDEEKTTRERASALLSEERKIREQVIGFVIIEEDGKICRPHASGAELVASPEKVLDVREDTAQKRLAKLLSVLQDIQPELNPVAPLRAAIDKAMCDAAGYSGREKIPPMSLAERLVAERAVAEPKPQPAAKWTLEMAIKVAKALKEEAASLAFDIALTGEVLWQGWTAGSLQLLAIPVSPSGSSLCLADFVNLVSIHCGKCEEGHTDSHQRLLTCRKSGVEVTIVSLRY